MIPDTYQTIVQPAEGLYKEKGSKFISLAFPIDTEDEIKAIIAKIRKEHFSAKHCCYAWSIGLNQAHYRINDDGEPSGTAGRPIYGQIQSNGVTNILIVVIRYFGGTLLGVSGLIQAYRSAAQDALSSANIVTKTLEKRLEIIFNYLAMNNLMLIIKEEQLDMIETKFELECKIVTKIRLAKIDLILSRILKLEGIISCQKIE